MPSVMILQVHSEVTMYRKNKNTFLLVNLLIVTSYKCWQWPWPALKIIYSISLTGKTSNNSAWVMFLTKLVM
jgi:hypothetical protein